jgi:hypothetical protein
MVWSEAVVSFVILVFGARACVSWAVDLDDEVEVRPAEVDLYVLDSGVDQRFGQAGFAGKGEEAVLELAARAGAARLVELERLLEHVQVVAPIGPLDRGTDGALVKQLAERGLVDHIRELMRGQHVAEVDQRARHRGHRDPVAHGHVAPVQASVRAHVHAREVSLARRQNVNARHSAAPELHMNRGIEGGEVGTVAARQDRRHPLALP